MRRIWWRRDQSTGLLLIKPPLPSHAAELFLRVEHWLLLFTAAVLPVVYTPGLLDDPYDMPKVTLLLAVVCLALSLRVAAGLLGAPWSGLRILLLPAAALSLAFVASWLASDYRSWSLLGLYLRYGGLIPYLGVIVFGLLAADAFAGRSERLLYGLLTEPGRSGMLVSDPTSSAFATALRSFHPDDFDPQLVRELALRFDARYFDEAVKWAVERAVERDWKGLAEDPSWVAPHIAPRSSS